MRPKSDDTGGVLKLTEAARFMRVSEKTLREMARFKRVPCQKVGREWRFLRRGLEEWLAGQASSAVAAEPVAAYGQEALFPDAVPVVEEEKRLGFGDTAFTNNRREPLHRWVPWIAGFSAAFVEEVLDSVRAHSREPQDALVLDPFAGVGTTLVEGLKHGYNVVGFEINPYAALACEVKVSSAQCRLGELTAAINRIEEVRHRGALRTARPTSTPPIDFRSRTRFFSPAVEHEVLLLQDLIAECTNGYVRKLLRVAFGAVMVGFSNYSYEPSLSTRSAAGKDDVHHADVFSVFCNKLWEMQADIGFFQRHLARFEHKPHAQVHTNSYLKGSAVLRPHSVDVLVTSPPYLNNYHYVRNTRPQLYWLGLLKGNGDLKRLEEESFGRFWQTVRGAAPVRLSFALPELEQLLECIREQNPEKGVYGGGGWANYAATYFNDCAEFFRVTRRVMRPGGHVVVVIGNNIVQGIHIETDRFLAEIAESHGFRLEKMHRVRKKRTGSSIVNSSVRAGIARKPTELYEVAVQLTAPSSH